MSLTEIILLILLAASSAALAVTLVDNKELAHSANAEKRRLEDLNRQYDELDKLYDLSEEKNIQLRADLEKANKYESYNKEVIINKTVTPIIPLTARMVVPCELLQEEDLVKKELTKELCTMTEKFIRYEESYDPTTQSKVLRATLLIANK